MEEKDKYFLPYQRAWIEDLSLLRIMEKSRQIGASFADAYDSVRKAGCTEGGMDVWVSTRDERQARLYIEDCAMWAQMLQREAEKEKAVVIADLRDVKADMMEFASGCRIYVVSSNPNALAGKRGHVKLDEFALHQEQRLLYRVAKPVTQWGGTLSIISTHRGEQTVFNELIRDIRERGNPMGWSLHSVPVQKAVEEGLVEKIMQAQQQGKHRTSNPDKRHRDCADSASENRTLNEEEKRKLRVEFLSRLRAECIDEEQWLQEYCCTAADESKAFITFEMVAGCEERGLRLMTVGELEKYASGEWEEGDKWDQCGRKEGSDETHGDGEAESRSGSESKSKRGMIDGEDGKHSPVLYLGLDVARKHDLCVFDVGEKIGDVVWDRLRIEMRGCRFAEIEETLFRLLRLPQVKRACIDATGLGAQLAERAAERFEWKVEPITFTASMKEELAFGLRADFEERRLRIVRDERLVADLRGIKKEVSASGNIRFLGESGDSHCDRFWAKALRQHAARSGVEVRAYVG
jgi:phage FluMu gp28-like protein